MNPNQWVRNYEGGTSIQALADREGMSYWSMRQRLIMAGATIRRRGPRPKYPLPPRIVPRAAGPRAARLSTPTARGAGGRATHRASHSSPRPPVDDELVDLLCAQARELLEQRARAELLDAHPREVLAAMDALRVALTGGRPLLADTGSTRGVRINPETGRTERF
jgi:hypothetical protein